MKTSIKYEQNIKKLFNKKPLIIFIITFALIGSIILISTKAATPYVQLEADSGTITSPATKITDSASSGGSAVMFGSGTVVSNGTCSNITQYGITWTFDKSYPCGQFANSDWWVAPGGGTDVRITRISPDSNTGRNGWMINPSTAEHAYDNRIGEVYNAAIMPTLPYAAKPGESIVKSISNTGDCGNITGHPPCLTTAAVLTVLGTIPADNGKNTFRPSYAGNDKTLYTVSQLNTNLLPSLTSVASAPSLDTIKGRFQRVQLDHANTWRGRYMHPFENYLLPGATKASNYGSDLARDNGDAALRLMLNDSTSAKMPALINFVQAGIDWYGTVKNDGINYGSDGGHFNGRKMPILFAAILLNDTSMKNFITSNNTDRTFSENDQIYFASQANRPLYGKPCNPGEYERNLSIGPGGSGSRDCKDPSGQIDGGEVPGGTYQLCCTAKNFKAHSLATRLLPGGKAVWNQNYFHDYVDRWVNFGAWTLPDSQNRYPQLHGSNKNGGSYGNAFQENMWNTYRGSIQ